MTKTEIHQICEKYRIKNYTINSDMSIDVHGDVSFEIMDEPVLEEIPLNFNEVEGSFDCAFNNLKSLKGSPRIVHGAFLCNDNRLTSLKGSPTYIIRHFDCSNNNLNSLEGISTNSIEYVNFEVNNIKTFDYFPKIQYSVVINGNPLYALWRLFEDVKHIDYFNELDIIQNNGKDVILDRLNYFLTDLERNEVKKDNKPLNENYNVI